MILYRGNKKLFFALINHNLVFPSVYIYESFACQYHTFSFLILNLNLAS